MVNARDNILIINTEEVENPHSIPKLVLQKAGVSSNRDEVLINFDNEVKYIINLLFMDTFVHNVVYF